MKKSLLFSTLLLALLCFVGWGIFAQSPTEFEITDLEHADPTFVNDLLLDKGKGVNSELGDIPNRTKRGVKAYGKLPLSFEANQGQTDGQVNFLSRGNGYTLFLTPTTAVLSLKKPVEVENLEEAMTSQTNVLSEETKPAVHAVLRMQLLGANPASQSAGLDELPSRSNYYIGNDPQQWKTGVPQYARVQYKDVYPGVDLIYYGTNQRRLEYDFIISPGTDPGVIRLGFKGAEEIRLDDGGNLVLHAEGGKVVQHAPIIYQEIDGVRREISGRYVLINPNISPLVQETAISDLHPQTPDFSVVGFQVETYDTGKPLVIDPVLIYSTFLGGSGFDRGLGIAVDASGSAYVTGLTGSSDFPTENPFQVASGGDFDVFIAKLNPSGSGLLYATYLGGSSTDHGHGIAVDVSGSAYVTGFTQSNDFPLENPFQPSFGAGGEDTFITKLNASGSALIYSTYLGGNGGEVGYSIAVDASGNAYLTGQTKSSNFPTMSPLQPISGGFIDLFVTKINPSGSALVYSTYLGGNNFDRGQGIAVDASGSAYVTGLTQSPGEPKAEVRESTSSGSSRKGKGRGHR